MTEPIEKPKTYNGWTNYETWNVALWIDNDQAGQREWLERAAECYRWANDRGVGLTKEEQAKVDLSRCLKEQFEEDCPDLGPSCWSDLLSAALSEVNWYEIAEHMIDEVDKTAKPEETDGE